METIGMSRMINLLPLFTVIITALPAIARADDHAVVVGVNIYQIRAANLKGCVPDAEEISGVLTKHGFKVTKLLNEQATKAGILAALTAAKDRSRPTDRFVFFFAGHGTNWDDATTVILPHDFRLLSPDYDLSHQQLNQAVVAVPGRSRTIILDSCHSEGMMRGAKNVYRNRPTLQVRYFNRRDGAKDLVQVNRTDEIPTASGVCYVVACRRTETAAEDDIDGRRRGLFTYSLIKSLSGSPQVWGDVQVNVTKSVADLLQEDSQHPQVSPSFRARVVFDASATPPPPPPNPPAKTLWDLYSDDRIDPARVKLTMEPDYANGIVPIGKEFSLRTQVGQSGYLIIMERGTSGSVNLIFPSTREVDKAKVEAGARITSPEDATKAFIANAEGTEHVKAILFANRQEAASVLARFPESRKISNWSKLRDIVMVNRVFTFFTSTLSFEATNSK